MNFLYCNPRLCFLIFIHAPWHTSYQPEWSVARFCILPGCRWTSRLFPIWGCCHQGCCELFAPISLCKSDSLSVTSLIGMMMPEQQGNARQWRNTRPAAPRPPEARLNLDQQEMTLAAGGGRRWFLVLKSISDLFPLDPLPQGLPSWASLLSPAEWRQAWSSQDIAALGGLQWLFSTIAGNLHKVLCEFQKSVSKPNNWGSLILALQFSL